MTKKEHRREERTERIANYKVSGQAMKVWCASQGVTKDTLRYWLRTLKSGHTPAAPKRASFVPLTLSEPVEDLV
ncbi:IS66 family insertion sequence element accessory protein TnpA [Paenibacillus sp. IITD108]|uniref:IS66 family insertion sequence element accessory protein TnpA n=1 Tax=Paenibacillus sp. IITD108 TaxID=3116649 RepID=UPI003FA71595